MVNLNLAEICACLQLADPLNGRPLNFAGISTDSRNVRAGELFIALVGETFDGHNYLDQVIAAGATAVVVNSVIPENVVSSPKTRSVYRGSPLSHSLGGDDIPVLAVDDTLIAFGKIAALYRSKFAIPIIGITGSCGKTTVTQMVASILQKAGNGLAPQGSFNNEVGVPQTLLKLQPQHQFAVLEMGARNVGDIKYLMQIAKPTVTLINNVAPVHLETFGSVDQIAKVKGEIYQQLDGNGTAVINIDDVYAPYWLTLITTQRILTFGLEAKADITCSYIIEEHQQMKFELVTDQGAIEVAMPILGTHNVMNALAATAAARAINIDMATIKAGLESFRPATRRMQIKTGKNGARVIDDTYNANPVAMQKAIEVLAKQRGQKIMVVGDMLELGPNAEQIHQQLGEQIRAAQIDRLYAFGNLTRHTVEAYGADGKFYSSKADLAAALLPIMDYDTVVLVKGSNGMHLEEIINVIVAE